MIQRMSLKLWMVYMIKFFVYLLTLCSVLSSHSSASALADRGVNLSIIEKRGESVFTTTRMVPYGSAEILSWEEHLDSYLPTFRKFTVTVSIHRTDNPDTVRANGELTIEDSNYEGSKLRELELDRIFQLNSKKLIGDEHATENIYVLIEEL